MQQSREVLFLELSDLLTKIKLIMEEAQETVDALEAADMPLGEDTVEDPAKKEYWDFEGLNADVVAVTFMAQDGELYRVSRCKGGEVESPSLN